MAPELIETMLVNEEGAIPLLSRHLERLAASCKALDYPWDGASEIEQEVYDKVAELTVAGQHRLRLLLDRTGRRSIQTAPLPALVGPQTIMLSGDALDANEPLLRYKTTYRPWYADATQWLTTQPDVFDLIYVNQRGELCEGSRSNLYIQRYGVWHTPPLASGCLPGVQRAELLSRGEVQEDVLTLKDLYQAQGIRLSNALRGWFDVTLRTA
jgi:4-amino-4-deoxychorismate lyase